MHILKLLTNKQCVMPCSIIIQPKDFKKLHVRVFYLISLSPFKNENTKFYVNFLPYPIILFV